MESHTIKTQENLNEVTQKKKKNVLNLTVVIFSG